MISMRYHLVSLAAVFLALAVGVVLGSTALNGALLSGLSDEKGRLTDQVSDLETERNVLSARLVTADTFAGAVGPAVVDGTLARRSVVLVTTADARKEDRDALADLVRRAGATVTGKVQLTGSFTDPRKADQLRDLVVRLQPAGTRFPTTGDPGTLAGALLGSVLLLDADTAKPQTEPGEREAALAGLAGGGFITPPADVRPAQLAVVLVGGAAPGGGASDAATMLARFATQVDRSGAGAVLAGGAGSAGGSGALGVARADGAATAILSTVDNADTAAGRITTVLALREQLDGSAGRYGAAGNAEAPAPGVTSRGR